MERIVLTIGENSKAFGLCETNAPKAYDHGNTISLADLGEDLRLVLIPWNAVEWSRGRYGSGMYALTNAESGLKRYAEDWLWKRIYPEA